MPHVSTIDFRVRYAETDQMGVVYHANYLVWCELGRTYAELEAEGIVLAVSDAAIRFHAGARYDDMVRVSTTLTAVRSRMVTFDYDITHLDTGKRLVTARTTLVRLDRAGRPAALPSEFRALLESTASPSPERP